ncbi:hypothetical protein BDW59DRAFT_31779 [Aspergillus cavernicola]|uniref:Uncharacterized protein n=1 Tax=Aspergillus cavernicola TaxID=176166 RepID=A0ABR4HCV5_9EURO
MEGSHALAGVAYATLSTYPLFLKLSVFHFSATFLQTLSCSSMLLFKEIRQTYFRIEISSANASLYLALVLLTRSTLISLIMKCGFRVASCVSLLLFIPLYILHAKLTDLFNQYHAGTYLIDWLNSNNPQHSRWTSYNGDVKDKVIVMARLEEEPVHWVKEELPDWQRAIYTVNPSKATNADSHRLKTPLNKGHESMAYLTYLIDHYDTLPSTIAFIHSHRSGFLMAWHVDAPLHDNVAALRSLRLDFIHRNGYVNLRCNWNPGCNKNHRYNAHVTEDVWSEIFEGTSTPPLNSSSSPAQGKESNNTPDKKSLQIPTQTAAACCAQFAVSREQVLHRPREDYIKIRQWVIDTDKNDAASGRVMEFLWHVIFGKESIYCPDEELCYCQVYGQC